MISVVDASSREAGGYLHPAYGESLREFGTPVALPGSGAWILRRRVPQTSDEDGAGLYPLFCCADWRRLSSDVDALNGEIVSLVMVSDPFGDYDEALLGRSFPDLLRPFKRHYVVDLGAERDRVGSTHHRYYARWARRRIRVERANRPIDHLEEWTALYSEVLRLHAVTGIARFSLRSFERQLEVPGLTMFRAFEGDRVVGAQLWMIDRNIGFSHLTALDERGLRTRAAYALMAEAIAHFSGVVDWLDLGGGA